jgi:hypothetical protein
MLAASFIAGVLLTGSIATRPTPASADGPTPVTGLPIAPVGQATINFAELAQQQAAHPMAPQNSRGVSVPFHAQAEPADALASPFTSEHSAAPAAPSVASLAPSLSYQALSNIPGRSGFSFIPPDTMGAVGITRNFVTLNNDYRVQTKSTGATVSTVTMESFWASTTATLLFDPVTLYDPYNNRFIVVATSNPESATSSIVVGVSQTSDPNGTYVLARFLACSVAAPCGAGITDWWADYPTVGFNKNWVAIGVNMFPNAGGSSKESRMLVVDYTQLLMGVVNLATSTYFTGLTDFTIRPCVTYSNSENTLFAPAHVSSAGATFHLNTITGTPSAPVYTQSSLKTHTLAPLSGGWTNAGLGPDAPQMNGSGGPGDVAPINVGDSRIIRCTFRNNHVWYSQTVALPKGAPTHTAAQWVEVNTSGADLDGGRVEDTNATTTNGGKWYAYPSLSVNVFEDVLMGFTQFSSKQWPAAGYSMRLHSDAAGTMRDPYIVKDGEGMYWTTFDCTNASARNRWGDYSATQVDPVDDISLWTLQEYSLPEGNGFAATGCNSGNWSTWWAKVSIIRNFLPLIMR